MPSQYNLPEYYAPGDMQDVNQYNKLPFYLATVEADYFARWQVWDKMFGKINWQPNMGSILKSVRVEPSPILSQDFFPTSIQNVPYKDVIEQAETTEQASLCMHDFDSKIMSFLPSFQDFRENQIDATHNDIMKVIQVRSDQFVRSYVFQKCPNVYVPGAVGNELVSAPTIPSGTDVSTANVALMGKNAAWLSAQIATLNSSGVLGLNLATIDNALAVLRDDLAAPAFDGAMNLPKDNQLIKGKYVMVSSSEAFQMIKWDPNFQQFKPLDMNVIEDGFMGSIFNMVTWKAERYPMRIAEDGTFPAPETYDTSNNRTRPNPAYVAAPYEVAFLLGAGAFKTIKVGPPPKPFAGGKMDSASFFQMNWNGEVKLTDQILVNYSDGAGGVVQDLNYRKRAVKLFSSVVYGAIPVQQYNVLPIIFKRKRPVDLRVTGALL